MGGKCRGRVEALSPQLLHSSASRCYAACRICVIHIEGENFQVSRFAVPIGIALSPLKKQFSDEFSHFAHKTRLSGDFQCSIELK